MVGDALWGVSLLSEPYANQPTPWGLLGLMFVDAVLICGFGILFEIILPGTLFDLLYLLLIILISHSILN